MYAALGNLTTALNDFTGEPGLLVTETVTAGFEVVAAVMGVVTVAPAVIGVLMVGLEERPIVGVTGFNGVVGGSVGLPAFFAAAAACAAFAA